MIEVTTGSGAIFTGTNLQEVLWKMYQSFNAFETEDIDYTIRQDQRGPRAYPLTFNYWGYMGAIADRLYRLMRVQVTTTDINMFFDELLKTGVLQRISQVTMPSRVWPVEQIFGPLRPVRLGSVNLPDDTNTLQMPFQLVDWDVIHGIFSNTAEPGWSHQDANKVYGDQSGHSDTRAIVPPVQQPIVPESITPQHDLESHSAVIGVADIPTDVDVQALINAGARPVMMEATGTISLQTVSGDIIPLTPEQVIAAGALDQDLASSQTADDEQQTGSRIASKAKPKAS